MEKVEREWRFLVTRCPEYFSVEGKKIEQAYLGSGFFTVRARTYGETGFLTIKTPKESDDGAAQRLEFEYEIPVAEARDLIRLADNKIEKVRYLFPNGLEIDVFSGDLQGLILAEWEMDEGEEPEPPEGLEWVNISLNMNYTNRAMSVMGMPQDAVFAKRTKKAKI